MSIEFKSSNAIFKQIADIISQRILEGSLLANDRVPSVRELAEEFQVNRNTLLRTYSLLNDAGVIENRRGFGFFVSKYAVEILRKNEREEFFKNEYPAFMKKVDLLELNANDLSDLIKLIDKNSADEDE